jgi:hypothetical protein
MFTLDLTGSQQEIAAIVALAKQHSELEEVSEPTSLDASRALNVGLPHVDPQTALMFVTVVFQTSKAALEFLKVAREYLKERGGAMAVSQSASGKRVGRIEAATSDEALFQMVGK